MVTLQPTHPTYSHSAHPFQRQLTITILNRSIFKMGHSQPLLMFIFGLFKQTLKF